MSARGMLEQLLDDLPRPWASSTTPEAGRAGRREHVGASADLQAVAADIVEQVRVLDGLVRYRFGDNAELMGAWASARNVLGPFRSRVQPAAGQGETLGGEGPNVVKSVA